MSVTRREVTLQDQLQGMEPRPFDLLVHLIEQRHRVVPKMELLDRLWPHEFVSDSVIAQAVMKARQAIGDRGKELGLIRNIHRVGYRFVGQLHDGGNDQAITPPAEPLLAPLAASDRLALALLPFENRTGLAEFDWIELGLMSLSAKALAATPRLTVVSTSSLLTALGGLGPQASLDERLSTVRRVLGVRHVVHASVSREADQFQLDYGIAGAQAVARRSLWASEVTQLAQQLAHEVDTALFPQPTAEIPPAPRDPLADQALARAMQAVGEQKWKQAVDLLQVVLDIEPDNVAVQLERTRALAQLGDSEAVTAAEDLLARAQAGGDAMLAALAHQALGWACYTNKSQCDPAKHHLDAALRLAASLGREDWVTEAAIFRAGIALIQRDFDEAGRLIEQVQRVHERNGNQVHSLRAKIYEALIHTKQGAPLLAVELGTAVAQACEEYRLRTLLARTCGNLAHACWELGLAGRSIRHGEEAFAAARALSSWREAAFAGDSLCWFYRERRAVDESARVLAAIATFESELAAPVKAHLSMARGHHAAAQGDHAGAAALMRAPVEHYVSQGIWLTAHEMLPWLATALVQSGDFAEAAAVVDMGRSLPGYEQDPELRGALLHIQALEAHARGEASLQLLQAAADAAPIGIWRAHACLDAAWLHLERGNTAAARRLLRDLQAWLAEHPCGMLVDARCKFATGRYVAAADAQQRYLQTVQCDVPVYVAELARIYEEAVHRQPSSPPALPPAPVLPTRL